MLDCLMTNEIMNNLRSSGKERTSHVTAEQGRRLYSEMTELNSLAIILIGRNFKLMQLFHSIIHAVLPKEVEGSLEFCQSPLSLQVEIYKYTNQ